MLESSPLLMLLLAVGPVVLAVILAAFVLAHEEYTAWKIRDQQRRGDVIPGAVARAENEGRIVQ